VARRAAEHASPEAVELLEERYADQLLSVSDRQEFVTKDMAFHRQIAAITGNPIFPTLIEAMFEWLGAFYTQLISAPGAENLTMTEHRRILDAIAARNPAEAEAAMRDHLTRANELYRQFEVS
jgi:DNA-binding FadR family transcriptional regulator